MNPFEMISPTGRGVYLPSIGFGYIYVESGWLVWAALSLGVALAAAFTELKIHRAKQLFRNDEAIESAEDFPNVGNMTEYLGFGRASMAVMVTSGISVLASFFIYPWVGIDLVLGTLFLVQFIIYSRAIIGAKLVGMLDISE